MTESLCPWCHAVEGGTTRVAGDAATPVAGSVAVCDTCGRLSIYDDTAPGGRRFPTLRERQRLEHDPGVRAALDAVADLRAARRKLRPW